jgi:hypothetical protein
MTDIEIQPQGPFSLAAARDFAGGFPFTADAVTRAHGPNVSYRRL